MHHQSECEVKDVRKGKAHLDDNRGTLVIAPIMKWHMTCIESSHASIRQLKTQNSKVVIRPKLTLWIKELNSQVLYKKNLGTNTSQTTLHGFREYIRTYVRQVTPWSLHSADSISPCLKSVLVLPLELCKSFITRFSWILKSDRYIWRFSCLFFFKSSPLLRRFDQGTMCSPINPDKGVWLMQRLKKHTLVSPCSKKLCTLFEYYFLYFWRAQHFGFMLAELSPVK